MNLGQLRVAFLAGQYRFRDHARRQMRARSIEQGEVREAVLAGEIIEEYPNHIYGPCCLVYGVTARGKHLHIVLSLPPPGWIITVYEPSPSEWIDYRTRRP